MKVWDNPQRRVVKGKYRAERVHFRGYPGNILTPCEGEDSVKWSFINSLKEAAYIVNGNCKNVMNMSQSDQVELWHSVLNGMSAYSSSSFLGDKHAHMCRIGNHKATRRECYTGNQPLRPGSSGKGMGRVCGSISHILVHLIIFQHFYTYFIAGNMETYQRVSSKLKLEKVGDQYVGKPNSNLLKSRTNTGETDTGGPVKTGRIPVRLYVWSVSKDFDDLEDAPQIDSWDQISYMNRPVEIHREEGKLRYALFDELSVLRICGAADKCFTLRDAVKALLPELFVEKTLIDEEIPRIELEEESRAPSDDESNTRNEEDVEEKQRENVECCCPSDDAETKLKLVRIQGIEPKLEIPFSWVVNNLMNPEHFLHICVFVKVPQAKPLPHDR
ncbi:Autophagy protein 5 [Vitis vinifera]|uniref:Autophagy protein 5 n=1 Tax=Vitis vinifera TaxID=29760 RepID=A0A438CBJ4_VITVI|nr:Autophagy protein 5 [Vitis vinifera]